MVPASDPKPARALALLLTINLFCYLDRYILAAIIPSIKADFLVGDADANGKAGLLTTAFLVSYMITAPIFGWLADRFPRWIIIGCSVAVWSIACGASGLAGSFLGLLLTRAFLGIGEAGYGPAAPTIISDLYPVQRRGAVLAWFYMAIPVGSAIGYGVGGWVGAHYGWRWAFYAVVPLGLVLGIVSLFMRDPPRGQTDRAEVSGRPRWGDYLSLARNPSYVLNTLGMAALTFAIGGISYWMPRYLTRARGLPASSKI